MDMVGDYRDLIVLEGANQKNEPAFRVLDLGMEAEESRPSETNEDSPMFLPGYHSVDL